MRPRLQWTVKLRPRTWPLPGQFPWNCGQELRPVTLDPKANLLTSSTTIKLYELVATGSEFQLFFFVFESCNASIALTASISRANQNLRLPHEQINVSVQFSPMPSGYRSSSPFWLLCPHVAFAYIYANRIGRRMNKPSLARTILWLRPPSNSKKKKRKIIEQEKHKFIFFLAFIPQIIVRPTIGEFRAGPECQTSCFYRFFLKK